MMGTRSGSGVAKRLTGRAALFVALVLGLVAVMIGLGWSVRNRLVDLERSTSDNSQWVVLQTEVETLKLQLALDGGDPLQVRLWFDILFSRIALLETSSLHHPLLSMPEFKQHHDRIKQFLDQTLPLIDGPDGPLLQALPGLRATLPAVRAETRALTLLALAEFAHQSDLRRIEISRTLSGLAILTGILVIALSVLAISLSRLYRKSQVQAEDMRLAGVRLQTIISSSADGVVVTNRGGWIVEFNPAAEAIFGQTRSAVMGQNAMSLFFPPELADLQRAALAAAARSATGPIAPFRIELEVIRADGGRLPVEVSIAASEQVRGSVVVAFVRDISGRRRRDQDLREARDRALTGERAKADFIAVMSHEMRTPLNGLIGSMALLDPADWPPDQRELLSMMRTSGQILLDHVNSVLDLSRAEAPQVQIRAETFDADRLIADCLDNQAGLASANGTRLQIELPGGPLGWVTGDPVRLRQVLLNLIGNAVKFTRQGQVTLEAERLPRADAIIGIPAVEFRVIDTGPGIAEPDLARVFNDFETLDIRYDRPAGGTGLGLGIARRLVQAMAGSIGVESEPGAGSLFWVRLPLPPAAEAAAPVAGLTPRAAPQSVLVIEDNRINREVLQRMLAAAGHRVMLAEDGEAGVALARQHRFDTILTDISMPRMDGVAATQAIREGGGPSSTARFIALTAHALPDEQAKFRAAGMQDCLIKPVSAQALAAALMAPARRQTGFAATGPHDAASPDLDRLPLMDEDSLRSLQNALGSPRAAGFLQRLCAEGDFTLSRLQGPERDPDPVTRQKLSHHLAGSCATFGLSRMTSALHHYDIACKSGQPDEAEAIAASLPPLWAETRRALERVVAASLVV